MIPCVLAIDGGATATRAVVAAADGSVMGRGEGGPCLHLLRPDSREQVARHLLQAVEQAAARAARAGGGEPVAVAAAWAGLTGLDAAAGLLPWLREVLARAPALRLEGPLRLSSDLDTAVEGALGPAAPGVLVYAGTGSVAVGRDGAGRVERAGGHGYLIDDRGGGFDLGRMALQAVVRAWDGRGPRTRLEQAVRAVLGVTNWEELRRAVYGASNPRALVASLAPLVPEAASQGDPVAGALVKEAADELARLAEAVVRRLHGAGASGVAVRFAGGVFRSTVMQRAFTEAVQARLPGAAACRGLLPPLGGAVLLALRSAGLLPEPAACPTVVGNLQRALGAA
ncbi:MAG TPA: BadF/BadG/BcrA/BcrD ATPase family protein [Limnochordales bacterium]